MQFRDWDVRCHPVFAGIITSLYLFVSDLRNRDENYRIHPKARLLARIYKIITEEIPDNPSNPRYYIGNTLGVEYREWKRAKFERYRLFFKYSGGRRLIIDAWMNDDNTLRKKGSSSDPYKLFRRMLDKKTIQDNFGLLGNASVCPWSEGQEQDRIPAQLN